MSHKRTNKNYLHFNLRIISEFKCIGYKRGLRYWPKEWIKNEGTLWIRHVTLHNGQNTGMENDSFIVLIKFFIRDEAGRLDFLPWNCFTWTALRARGRPRRCPLSYQVSVGVQATVYSLTVLGWVNTDRSYCRRMV